ncbi:MAG: ApbE family, partial [Acidimicrobiia bacterium]|nr:ApbE family [Acidimicrobiia bacterium]
HPRTGWPVGHHSSVSVIAPDTATADAIATVIAVLTTEAALSFAASCGGVACCLIAPDGTVTRSPSWAELELRPES